MITCPWCGTNYASFQSNCKNCGGPLPISSTEAASPTEELSAPPLAPRPISEKYAWRLLFTEAWGVVALVFSILGVVFTLLGGALTIAIVTAFVGIPFLLIGLVFLGAGLGIGAWRYGYARQIVNVLRLGDSTQGQITDVQKNYAVRVNGQNPWVIRYEFQVNGQTYDGLVRTLNSIGSNLQAGKTVYILYSPNAPQWNSIYPHP